jgi:hypothetical protein
MVEELSMSINLSLKLVKAALVAYSKLVDYVSCIFIEIL